MPSLLVPYARDRSRDHRGCCAGCSCVHQLCPRGLHALEESLAQQIQVGPAKHLSFQHFQAVDMSLNGAVAPRERHPSLDRGMVVAQPGPAGAFAQEYTVMRNTLFDNKLYDHEKASRSY